MPVCSFSRSSNSANHFLPSRFICLNSSSSALCPSFISLPSFTVAGGSSTMPCSIMRIIAAKFSSFNVFNMSVIFSARQFFSNPLSAFSWSNDRLSNTRSFPFALPYDILLIIRSISYISRSASFNDSLSSISAWNSVTTSSLLFISSISSKGYLKLFFNSREPMPVSVLSSTLRSVPRCVPSRMLLNISRFRTDTLSNTI